MIWPSFWMKLSSLLTLKFCDFYWQEYKIDCFRFYIGCLPNFASTRYSEASICEQLTIILAAYFVGLNSGFRNLSSLLHLPQRWFEVWLFILFISRIETSVTIHYFPFLKIVLLSFPTLCLQHKYHHHFIRNMLVLFHFQHTVRKYYVIQMCIKWN